MNTNPDLPQSFWDKVEKTTTCWEWKGPKTKSYGYFYFQGKPRHVHRIVCPGVPDGKRVVRLCNNCYCVNPDHLQFVAGAATTRVEIKPASVFNEKRFVDDYRRKLSDEDIEVIRSEPATRGYVDRLMSRFSVSLQTIYRVRNARKKE